MRTKKGHARTKSRKRLLKRAKGHVGGRRRLLRTAKETLLRAGKFAFRDRRAKKRKFRQLWIIRLNAACRERGLRYSQLIAGLHAAQIELDRKSLSEMAIHDPPGFDAVIAEVKKALEAAPQAAKPKKEAAAK
jgi:large subunit ribosomal protein L20